MLSVQVLITAKMHFSWTEVNSVFNLERLSIQKDTVRLVTSIKVVPSQDQDLFAKSGCHETATARADSIQSDL